MCRIWSMEGSGGMRAPGGECVAAVFADLRTRSLPAGMMLAGEGCLAAWSRSWSGSQVGGAQTHAYIHACVRVCICTAVPGSAKTVSPLEVYRAHSRSQRPSNRLHSVCEREPERAWQSQGAARPSSHIILHACDIFSHPGYSDTDSEAESCAAPGRPAQPHYGS